MIDPNLGFDPNAPGVKKVYVKPYSERYAYAIDPYVYGEYVGSLRDLIMGQYQRLVKMVDFLNTYGWHITVGPFNMDRFRWDLELQADIIGAYDCRVPVTFMDKYPPKLLILTDSGLTDHLKEALTEMNKCINWRRV